MTKIVLGKKEKIDLRTTLKEVDFVDSVQDVKDGCELAFVEGTDKNLSTVDPQAQEVYIPAHLLTTDQAVANNTYVYFDLENYPFYQSAKAIIEKEDKPKGVFRYRRKVKEGTGEKLFASDIYMLASLLGEPQGLKVKKTDPSVIPAHIIVMVNFGGGTMAHIEYTISDEDRIELEWSGTKNIIEFDSDQMTPISPKGHTTLPLAYSVDSIVSLAHKLDQSLLDELDKYNQLIDGGAQ